MRNMTTLAMIGLLAACKPAPENVPAATEVTAPPVPEAKADGPAAATTAVSLDGEGLLRDVLLHGLGVFGQRDPAFGLRGGQQIDVSGKVGIGAGGFRFRGEARARDTEQGTLDNLLNIIGRREGDRSVISIG